jgi:CRP/FNR family transcriptional regulator, cyclic AMP receptor protein
MNQSDLRVTQGEMHRLSLFKSTNFDDVEEVLSQCSVLRVGPGKIVIAAGQPNRRLYLVLEGELSIRLETLENPPVATIGKGEVFGELSVIDGGTTSAFVVTETACRILGLDGDNLWELFRRTPYVAHNLLNMMASRIRKANKGIEDLQRQLAQASSSS